MQHSRAITRKSASNLALAFILLPQKKREAMSALYAFCREVDDIADEESVSVKMRREQLAAWREDIKRACENGAPQFPVNRELQPVIREFQLPFTSFDDILKGCEMDLDHRRYESLEELNLYCYRVASAVGLLSIQIFGFKNPQCRDYAVHLGQALQLTNILRDVREDAERGRIYLPLAELKKFQVAEDEILQGKYSPRYHALAEKIAKKAREHYRKAHALLPPEDRRSMVSAELMGSVYWNLLKKIEAGKFNVFAGSRFRLNKAQKIILIFSASLRFFFNSKKPNYSEA